MAETLGRPSGPRRGTPGLGRNGMPNDVRKWPNSMLPSSTRPGPGGFNRRKADEVSFARFSSGLNNAQPRMSDGTGGFNRGKTDQDSFAGSSSELNNAQPRHGTGQGGTPTLKDSKWAPGNPNGYQPHNPASTWDDVRLTQSPNNRLAMSFNNGRGGYGGEHNGGDHRGPWRSPDASDTQGGVSQNDYSPNQTHNPASSTEDEMVPENGNGDPIHVGADGVTLRGRGRFSASAGILQQDSPYFNTIAGGLSTTTSVSQDGSELSGGDFNCSG